MPVRAPLGALAAAALAMALAARALALEVPPAPSGYVTDLAGVVPAGEQARLDSRLAALERSTGHQVVVALFPSLEQEAIEDFTIRTAEQWKIGRRGLDDGMILFAFLAERKMRLEVGYGLEATVPDAIARRLLDDAVRPAFARGDYAGGIEALAVALQRVFGGQPLPAERVRERERFPSGLLVLIVVLVLSRLLGGGRGRRRRSLWLGALGGFGGGGFGGGGGFSGRGGSFGGGGASGSW